MKKSIKITLDAYRVLRRAQEITSAKQYRLSELAIKAALGKLTETERDTLIVIQKELGVRPAKKEKENE